MRSHDKRKYNQGRAFQHEQEECVDDLLIASMAVASTWCDEKKPSPREDDSSDSDTSASESSESDNDTDGGDDDEDVDGQKEDTLGDGADKEEVNTSSTNTPKTTSVSTAQKNANSDSVDGGKQSSNNEAAETTPQEDADDDSDIDLTEDLANMIDEDDDLPTKKSSTKNQKSTFKGPHTENEINPYTCPTDELEKLNISVGGSKHDIIATKYDDDGGIVVDDNIRRRLKIAGTVRSHIVEQRTIVVDSFIPSTLQRQQDSNLVDVALGEGSVLVIVTMKDGEGRNIASSLMDDDGNTSYSLQVIGKIMEVFGPVQRPLYVIRLPSTLSPEKITKIDNDGLSDKQSKSTDDKNAPVSSTEDTNEITIEALEEEDVETSRNDEGYSSKEDPWDTDGKLTTMIKSCSSTAVYCLMDHVNLIDTDQIIRVSGKGCDASNMHDEEVAAKELDYSDDEEERQAKRKGKKKPARGDNSDQRADTKRGKGSGRGDGGRGSNRGDRGNWKGGNGYSQAHQSHPQQPHYAYPPPNQMYQQHPQNRYPLNQMYQAHPPQNYAHAQPTPYQSVSQYQQPHHQQQYQPNLYQQQYQQQPYQQPYQQQQYAAYPHGVPPPPPPPTQAQQSAESDTVYYDYSGS